MGIAEFYASSRSVSSITDAGGRLLGWTDGNGNALLRVGGGVNAAGGTTNVFAYADPRLDRPNGMACDQPPRPAMQRPSADVTTARANDQVTPAPKRPSSMTSRQRDMARKMILMSSPPAVWQERWARELVARHPSWFPPKPQV